MQRPRLSVILLAYNEANSLPAAVEDAVLFLRKLGGDHEVVIIDDGSTDQTYAIACQARARFPEVKVVQHGQNRGMGAGMRSGILHSTKDYFTVLAADGQVGAGELEKMLPLVSGSNVVLSRYQRRDDGALRKIYSRGFRIAMLLILGYRIPLEGIYLFPVELAKSILASGGPRSQSFLFSFELIDAAMRRGHDASTVVTINCRKRLDGHSKVTDPRRISKMLGEMLEVRWAKLYRQWPNPRRR